jgi:hypothetical protein
LNVDNVFIAHCIIGELKRIVGEHEGRVNPLRSLDPPRRVNHHHVEARHIVYPKELEVKVLEVTVKVRLTSERLRFVFFFLWEKTPSIYPVNQLGLRTCRNTLTRLRLTQRNGLFIRPQRG